MTIKTRRGKTTRTKIAEILEMLGDGHWHLISEVETKVNLNACRLEQIIEFLKTYEFVAVDSKRSRVKLEEAVREFLIQEVTS